MSGVVRLGAGGASGTATPESNTVYPRGTAATQSPSDGREQRCRHLLSGGQVDGARVRACRKSRGIPKIDLGDSSR